MANTILTPDMITREAARVLHQKLNFIGSINRQYDSSFAQTGAKIGDTLRIRLPAQYTVRTTMARSVQDHVEQKVDLPVTNVAGVDVDITSQELTLSLDDFSQRVLQPAMAVIAAKVESDALQDLYKDVYNEIDNIGSSATFATVLNARKKLVDNLAPQDNNLNMNLNTQDNVDLVDALKGLFNDTATIGSQYREGMMGRTAGMNFFENTLMPSHTTGTAAASTGYLVNGASQTGATLTVDTGTTTFVEGDIITIAGVNRVHPETKLDTGVLQQFVVTSDSGASATSLSISPSITATGGQQNVTGSPADNAAITKLGGASATHGISLGYHRDAFAFATADLVLPGGTDMASRQVFDGISIRMVRDFDNASGDFGARFDVLYGYTAVRPQLAVRLANN